MIIMHQLTQVRRERGREREGGRERGREGEREGGRERHIICN